MDANTGGSAQAVVLCKARSPGPSVPARTGVHCHPKTIISAVAHPSGDVHRMSVAGDCRKVDS